jgi:hypothetical protein
MGDYVIFNRGNAVVRSESLRDGERIVAVSEDGSVYAYKGKSVVMEQREWAGVSPRLIAHVGKMCWDWKHLVFFVDPSYPSQNIDPAIWAGLDAIFGKPATGIAWGLDGRCFGYTGYPEPGSILWENGGDLVNIRLLNGKFEGDWRKSWTPRPSGS